MKWTTRYGDWYISQVWSIQSKSTYCKKNQFVINPGLIQLHKGLGFLKGEGGAYKLGSLHRNSIFCLLLIDRPTTTVGEVGEGKLLTTIWRYRVFSSCYFRGTIMNVSEHEDLPSGLVDIERWSEMPPNLSVMFTNWTKLREPKWFDISF